MKLSTELRNALAQFTGTEGYYVNRYYPWMKYTDGVKFFAENAGNGAYWLLDILGTEIRPLTKTEGFLHIKLNVGLKCEITADDGNDNVLWRKPLEWTDCPDGEWHFYLTDDVLMIPSEY